MGGQVSGGGEEVIDTVTASILSRRPGLTRDRVRAEVARSCHRLAAGARVADHLPVLVQHEALQRLDAAARG